LSCERFALDLCFPSQLRQQRRRSDYIVSRCFPCRFRGFRLPQRTCPATLDFESLGFDASRILTDHTHVTFSTLDFLLQVRRRVLARHRLTLFTTDRFVQQNDCIFQLDQPIARSFRRSRCRINFRREHFGTRFQFSQLAFEREQARTFLQVARVAGRDRARPRHLLPHLGQVHNGEDLVIQPL